MKIQRYGNIINRNGGKEFEIKKQTTRCKKEVIKMDMYQKRKIRAKKKKDDSPKSFPSVGINW